MTKNTGAIIIIIAILIGSLIIHSVNKNNTKQKNAALLSACLSDAEVLYSKQWDSECWAKNKAKDCSLSVLIANQLANFKHELKESCYYKFPQK